MKKILLVIVIVGALSVTFLYKSYSGSLRYQLNSNVAERISVTIPEGANGGLIAEILAEEKLIKNERTFNHYLKLHKLDQNLKAGRYVLLSNMTLPEIVDTLTKGSSGEEAVTLLEGWTIEQVADYLELQGVTTKAAFLECVKTCEFDYDFLPGGYLEGYLYPDTYFVSQATYSDESFINRLISTLESKLSAEDWAAIESSERTFEEIMIMASIVEREERSNSQRPTVAGILWNRFDEGAGLGADATVLYALGRTSGGLNYNDLQVDSPYNTRKYAGLPPTPIANPGITSILAAIYPDETNYWYYLHDSDGAVHYAETLEEHNENKAKYLR